MAPPLGMMEVRRPPPRSQTRRRLSPIRGRGIALFGTLHRRRYLAALFPMRIRLARHLPVVLLAAVLIVRQSVKEHFPIRQRDDPRRWIKAETVGCHPLERLEAVRGVARGRKRSCGCSASGRATVRRLHGARWSLMCRLVGLPLSENRLSSFAYRAITSTEGKNDRVAIAGPC